MIFKLVLAFLAAFGAGNMNAVTGGGTFLTYPMLLLLGNSSIVANGTSTVLLWPGVFASLFGYKDEIRQSKYWIKILCLPALAGAVVGSFVLTHTPQNVFDFVAPILIAIGATILQFQAQIIRLFGISHLDQSKRKTMVVAFLVFAIGTYGAYFGAGIGILLIGSLSILGFGDLLETIGLKNVLSLLVNLVAAIYFSFSGIVHWQIVPLMTCGVILGGYSGSRLVHHVNREYVRRAVVMLGFGIAITLLTIRLSK